MESEWVPCLHNGLVLVMPGARCIRVSGGCQASQYLGQAGEGSSSHILESCLMAWPDVEMVPPCVA